MFEYKATFSIKLREIFDGVRDLENSIDKTLEEFGYDDKMTVKGNIFDIKIKVSKKLTAEEEHKISVLLEAEIIKKMPKYNISLSSFSQVSEQAVLQSAE